MNKVIILDGYNMLFRSYYATYNEDPTKLLHNKNGIPTNAIYAFSNMVLKIIKELDKGDGLFVALDSSKTTFRHQEYKEYKANRKPLDENLKIQFPIFREFLEALNIPHYENSNLEADDIAGIVAKMMEKADYKVQIYTADKDYLQLIDENITINLVKQGLSKYVEMTPQTFKEEWGFDPIKIIDYKAMRGDDSDNLKGIPGIGDKTAKQLINQFGDYENIVKNANTKTKVGRNLIECQENGRMCLHLATIKLDENLSLTPSDIIYSGYDFNKINEFILKYDFLNLLNKLPKNYKLETSTSIKLDFKEIENIDSLNIKDEISLGIDINQSLNYHNATLNGLALTLNNKNYYIKKSNLLKDQKLLDILKSSNVKKNVFDYKKTKYVLGLENIEISNCDFDLLLASYLLNPNLKPEINDVLLFNSINLDTSNVESSFLLLNDSNPNNAIIYSYFAEYLKDSTIKKLKENNQYSLLKEIEIPLSEVLEEMEKEGFPLDKLTLLRFKQEYEIKLNELKKQIYKYSEEEFNINSPKQLGEILFDKLNLPSNKQRSTSVEILNKLEPLHPIIPLILEYRKYQKLLSTYVDGYMPYIDEKGLIHATFNQALTSTGRLSSSEPNLQNISIRDNEGKNIRKAFFYREDNLNILSLDYSQIELRILAHLSNSKTLIDAFNNDEDIHSLTAKKIFHIDREPTSDERRIAKATNFGIVYGISDWGLSETLHISVIEARNIISSFYQEFPEIKDYLNNLVEFAKINKYSLTMFNRRRYLTEINNSSYQERNFEKRAAMNAPIQGSAADLIKIAMIEVNKTLKEKGYEAKIINQIHDEIILKVNDKEKDEVLNVVKNVMENCVKLNVKLKVDGGYAKTWYNAK